MNEKRKRDGLYYKNQNNYIGDNLVRRLQEPELPNRRRNASREAERRLKARENAQKKEKTRRVIFTAITTVVVLVCVVGMLSTISRNNELTSEVSSMENQIEELQVLNDSKEYTIDSSVDLSYVIQVATNELGMVRSSASQIKTFTTDATEYVQQVAEVPTE